MSHTPLVIYVLWHPAATEAAALASEVYRWFHASSDDLLRSGMGVPVFFRSAPRDRTGGTPRPIQFDEADLNVVVVLAEQNMVADPSWAQYLTGIGDLRTNACIVPVALHPSAYRVPEVLRQLNFLRLDERDDPPVDAVAQRARALPRLVRQLTEVIGRQLAAQLAAVSAAIDGGTQQPLTIFLSHAKRDGIDVAEAVRSTIQNNGRLRAFFDDSDLPVGHAFAAELERAAVTGSAAMMAIVSDAYAARPWCRKEVALARKPRRDPAADHCWWIQPVLVVDALKSSPSRSIPELGNATVVRWSPEGALATVDLLMLEVLLGSYHRLRARRIQPANGRHVISWTPDVPTLLSLQHQAGEPVKEVVYPGHALPQTELQSLRDQFTALELRTFEETERPPDQAPAVTSERVVGLSTAFNEDLGPLGFGREHLEEVTLRIARCIVDVGGRIAFGGMLNSSGLTETLLTLVRTLSADDDAPSTTRVPRVLSYQRWPSLPGPDRIASDVGISEYVLIDNPMPAGDRLADDARVASPRRARELAHTLSTMREAMTRGGRLTSAGRPAPALHARIVVGGKRIGFNGCMPGVLEEVLYALEQSRPVYVVGGFGGAAGTLARAVLFDEQQPDLEIAYHRERSSNFRVLELGLAQSDERHHIDTLFPRLRRAIAEVRADIAGRLDNGLDREENLRLMLSDHVAEIAWLLRRGLARRLAAVRTADMRATRVYTCFDATGSKNPAVTDLKYYFLLRAWSSRAPLVRTFVDVHGATGRRKPADLRRELINRMRKSDVLLLILSERTRVSAGLLSWEIEFAANYCKLPIVCAYTGCSEVDAEAINSAWWPEALRRSVTGGQAEAVHVPFQPRALARAFRRCKGMQS